MDKDKINTIKNILNFIKANVYFNCIVIPGWQDKYFSFL